MPVGAPPPLGLAPPLEEEEPPPEEPEPPEEPVPADPVAPPLEEEEEPPPLPVTLAVVEVVEVVELPAVDVVAGTAELGAPAVGTVNGGAPEVFSVVEPPPPQALRPPQITAAVAISP